MFIRKSFDEFLKPHSDAVPTAEGRDWVIDWRWLARWKRMILPKVSTPS
jgi:hypothetical protein